MGEPNKGAGGKRPRLAAELARAADYVTGGVWLFALAVFVLGLAGMAKALLAKEISAVQEAAIAAMFAATFVGVYAAARAGSELAALARRWSRE